MIRSLNALAIRNAGEARVRTILSVFVVMLGVAMMIATDSFADSMRAAMPGADEGQNIGSFAVGIIDMLMSVVGIVILLAAAFLIFNAFLMSVTQRRQQIGMLRSIGMTRRQIIRLVMIEGLTIGIIGTVLGLIAGPLLAQGLAAILRRFGGGMFTVESTTTLSLTSMLIAALLGIGVTLLAVLIPAWNATKVSPLAALRPAETGAIEHSSRRYALIAAIIAVILFVFLIVNPPGEWVEAPQDAQLSGLFIVIWLGCLLALLPILIEQSAQFARRFLSQKWKATGRLMADNLERERQRVTLTVLTMTIGLTVMIGMTGMTQFIFHKLLFDVMAERSQRTLYAVLPFDMNAGIGAFTTSELQFPPDLLDELMSETEGLADVAPIRIAFIPELTSVFPDSFSYVMSPTELRLTGDFMFTFSEGDWETATPIMEAGCGVLMAPLVASKLDVRIGESFTVNSRNGAVECTVAGLGMSMGMSSIVGLVGSEPFEPTPPIQAAVVPRIGVDDATVENILFDIRDRYPGIFVEDVGTVLNIMVTMTDGMTGSLNGILVIAVIAAALGIVNTTMMSVQERRHELGLIRAVGATRSQVRNLVMGEAALMGFIGAIVGLLAGAGMTIIFVVTYGGNGVGLTDLALWPTALEVLRPALVTGIVGLIVAPLIAALAAWFPVRNVLKGSAIETLNPVG